ncbi:MAG TPA: GAF domain-containing protein, partial [Burkholderiales bacterium]|nr:GAF domain-containing protein [Burkholderiales bacterium]
VMDSPALAAQLEARTRELAQAADQLAATSEVLRAISNSRRDPAPVLKAVAEHAARLCDADITQIFQKDGELLRVVASHGPIPSRLRGEALRITRGSVTGRSVIDRRTIHVHDLSAELDTEFPDAKPHAGLWGHRTVVATPLLQEGAPIGAIFIRRTEVRPFSEQHIALLETFADQAVIAIENVRLFKEIEARNRELTESLEQQTATSEILRVISSSPTDIQPVLDSVAENGGRLCGADDVVIRLVDGNMSRAVAHYGSLPVPRPARVFSRAQIIGRAIIDCRTMHVHDANDARVQREFPDTKTLTHGFRTFLAVPLVREDTALGAIVVRRLEVSPFSDKQIKLLETFAAQAVIAIENVRLFDEIQEKSAQLEVFNRHKSEFLANMSHELRTPLNAVIGFSEVLGERLFGELTEKQDEYVKDIHASGKHLLSLINDILDLSKIEAGRMELELADFALRPALENAITLLKERAHQHGIKLELEIDPALGLVHADERKFKQVILNLLSNAVKFTPDGGSVSVCAKANGTMMEVAVSDTGPGIAPEDQAAVFEEFKQVGPASAGKAAGTGLGLPLTKKIIELHGGEIRLESAPGRGSIFTFTGPIRCGG